MAWADLLQTFSTIIAALSVVAGITSWRRTELGKRRVELAEEVLENFSKLRDSFEKIRSPISSQEDGSTRERREKEFPVQSMALDRFHGVIERCDKQAEVFNKLHSLRPRAEVYLGREFIDSLNEVTIIKSKIIQESLSLTLKWMWKEEGSDQDAQIKEMLDDMSAKDFAFAKLSNDEDKIEKQIKGIISRVEEVCCKSIFTRPTLAGHIKIICESTFKYLGIIPYK